MNARTIIGNFSIALAAQGVNILMGIITSLLVPKVLGVEEFGYWQLFIFYTSYVGFFHLGLYDGVYLKEGGKARSNLDAKALNSQFLFSLFYQLVFAVIIVVFAFGENLGDKRQFVLLMTAIFLLLNNATTYLGYLLQVVNEIKRYSASVALNSFAFLIPLCVLLILGVQNFEQYVIFYAVAKAISLFACILWNKDILTAGLVSLKETVRLSFDSIRIGIKLMFANITGSLILGVSRFIIDANWDIATFGIVSFAFSIVSFFMVFISQASMVLFPALRREKGDKLPAYFTVARDCLDLFLPITYILYYPAILLLGWWLPAYSESFSLFAILLPLCVFNGKMDIVGTTFLKVLRKERYLLIINMGTLLLSISGAVVGSFVFHSIEFMLLSAVVSVGVRSVVVEKYIAKCLTCSNSTLFISSILQAMVFLIVSLSIGVPFAFVASLLVFALSLIINRGRVMEVVHLLKHQIGG